MKNSLKAFFILSFVCLAAYSNALHNDFLIDDHDLILGNPPAHHLDFVRHQLAPWATDSATTVKPPYYRPLAHIIPFFLYVAFKTNVTGYHMVDLLLFILLCFSIYSLLNSLLNDRTLSLITSLLFAMHPLSGILMNYKNLGAVLSLQALAMIWASIFFLKEKQKILSLLLFIIANLCHDTAIILPLYLLLFSYFKNQKLTKRDIIRTVPFFIIAALFLTIRLSLTSASGGTLEQIKLYPLNFLEYLATYAKIIAWYVSKFINLDGIVLIWAAPVVKTHLFAWISLLIAGGAVLAGIFASRKKYPEIFLLVGWLVIGFAAVAWGSLYGLQYGLLIEPHWLIFPSIGIFALMAFALLKLRDLIDKRIFYVLIAAVLFTLIAFTRDANRTWAHEKIYCKYWLKYVPGFIPAKNFLASHYMRQGQMGEAKKLLLEIVQAEPTHALTYSKLGWIYYLEGDFKEAIKNYEQALRLFPNSVVIKHYLGLTYEKTGDLKKAADLLRVAK